MDEVMNEVNLMEKLNHPNILKLEDRFRYKSYMCLITEYAEYKDLYYLLMNYYPNGMPEKIASLIFLQMLKAVKYLHDNNICHRDIKLDNFLVFNPDPTNLRIVLSDFGLSKYVEENELCDVICGTYEYMSPEMHNNKPYNKKVDIWSLGISLFVLLTAKFPFPTSNESPKTFKKFAKKGKLNYKLLKEMNISENAINFIHKLCAYNPSSRINIEDAINNAWMVQN